jgi:hypothetical protein
MKMKQRPVHFSLIPVAQCMMIDLRHAEHIHLKGLLIVAALMVLTMNIIF